MRLSPLLPDPAGERETRSRRRPLIQPSACPRNSATSAFPKALRPAKEASLDDWLELAGCGSLPARKPLYRPIRILPRRRVVLVAVHNRQHSFAASPVFLASLESFFLPRHASLLLRRLHRPIRRAVAVYRISVCSD